MAENIKIIDLSKSYLPGDPNALLENLGFTAQEDNPTEVLPVIPYEGYNFLPTAYGYRSYFGTNATLAVNALPNPICDEVLLYQISDFKNMLIALCSDGIYTLLAPATSWTKSVALTDQYAIDGSYLAYTWVVLDNDVYIYRQGHTHVAKIDNLAGAVSTFIPSFLNMTGQMGIFRANGRLGFWDSANSVSWSSAVDYTDFTPNITTLVGNLSFVGVQGRITTIVAHGEGFIIYATRSIVGVSYSDTGTNLWDAMILTEAGGVAYPKSVTVGQNTKEHFCFTSTGIYAIGHFNALSRQYDVKPILPELYDFLKESRDPVFLKCMSGRYLHFILLDEAYVNGLTSFIAADTDVVTVAEDNLLFLEYNNAVGGMFPSNLDSSSYARTFDFPERLPDPYWAASSDPVYAGDYCLNLRSGSTAGITRSTQTATGLAAVQAGTFNFDFAVYIEAGAVVDFASCSAALRFLYADFYSFYVNALMDVPAGGSAFRIRVGLAGAGSSYTGYHNLTTAAWNFISVSITPTAITLYINDALIETKTATTSTWVKATSTITTIYVTHCARPDVAAASNQIFSDSYKLYVPAEYSTYASFPSTSFTLQTGSPAPAYPDLYGSLVFDLHLKKWGKQKNACKALVSLASLNETQNAVIPYTNFGMDGGILTSTGEIKLWDVDPADNFIRYGKIGFYRQGFTTVSILRLHFRILFTGTITLDCSIDGRSIDLTLQSAETFTDVLIAEIPIKASARWYTISISGKYDLQYLEFGGRISGKR